jgi:hypothetical protein
VDAKHEKFAKKFENKVNNLLMEGSLEREQTEKLDLMFLQIQFQFFLVLCYLS